MAESVRKSNTGVLTRQPSGAVQWHRARSKGYKIRCLAPYRRFRGTEIPWDDELSLLHSTEFVAKASRSRKVVKLTAGQFGTPIELYVKRYNFKTWYSPYLRMARRSRAREEFELGWKLMKAGINTPRPVWLAEATGTVPDYSLLATEAIPESESVTERWQRLPTEEERRELLVALGRFLLSIHETGLYHDDCKAGHVQVLPDSPSTPSEFFIIDLLGCRLMKSLSKYRRGKNLYQILRSFYPKHGDRGFTGEHRAILLQAYGGSLAEAARWERWVKRMGKLKGREI